MLVLHRGAEENLGRPGTGGDRLDPSFDTSQREADARSPPEKERGQSLFQVFICLVEAMSGFLDIDIESFGVATI